MWAVHLTHTQTHTQIDTRARMGRYDDGEEEDLDLEEVRLCFTSFLEMKML